MEQKVRTVCITLKDKNDVEGVTTSIIAEKMSGIGQAMIKTNYLESEVLRNIKIGVYLFLYEMGSLVSAAGIVKVETYMHTIF
ncbi:hypothetical protein CS562_22660 [Paenibacillus sp. LK1]|nr:hypothetical protein CS562_22660 [Paenibacillus sp. LK1]